MTVWVGDQRHQLQPGGFAFLARNIPHAVRYDMASRALVLCIPARHQETIFPGGWDLTKPLPAGWQITQEQLRQAAEQGGNTVIAPRTGSTIEQATACLLRPPVRLQCSTPSRSPPCRCLGAG